MGLDQIVSELYQNFLSKKATCESKQSLSKWRSKRAIRDQRFGASSTYGSGSDLLGAFSSGGSDCCPPVVDPLTFIALLGFIAAATYFLQQQITMLLGRRRRKRSYNERLQSYVMEGLEEFEDKVDKIANGQDDNSWIGQLYQQFSSNIGIDGSKIDDDDIGDKDGLEPPILDETWGLEDIHKLHESEEENSDEPRSISKRDVKDNEIQNDEDDVDDGNLDVISDLMGLEGESKCKARLFSCLGNVAKGSMHYMNEPGGVTGALQKVFFRVAFHGGIGNVWKALMTIPEARKIKRCINKQDNCMIYEVLRKEVETLDEDGEKFVSEEQRLLINPEFVESMDNSDGSEKFSPEDQAIEDASTDY